MNHEQTQTATNETIADIVAAMRGRAEDARVDRGLWKAYADRIEAAAKRERIVIDENTSDGYHTFKELYRYRMLYNAAFFNLLSRTSGVNVVKSFRHGDGERCFGGGWFIVMAELECGQISNHYEEEYWGLFNIPAVERAPIWDGHTPNEAADRLEKYLIAFAEKMEPISFNQINNTGNAAALMVAMKEIRDCAVAGVHSGSVDCYEIIEIAEKAMAAPARNCDLGTAEERVERFGRFCISHKATLPPPAKCVRCRIRGEYHVHKCIFEWEQMPYVEGGEA